MARNEGVELIERRVSDMLAEIGVNAGVTYGHPNSITYSYTAWTARFVPRAMLIVFAVSLW